MAGLSKIRPAAQAQAYAYGATVWTKYYFAGAQRAASRACSGTTCNAPVYTLSDHLGSTSLSVDASGAKIAELRYTAWGEARYTWGNTPTDYTYTGQYSNVPDFGLYYYNARWYDGQLGRFAQADTIIPVESQGVQAWDRYAYVNNNPVRYSDPSGHCIFCVALVLAVTVAAITPISSDPLISNLSQHRIKNDTYGVKCSASLSSCYQQGTLSTLENGQVSNDEFSQLLEAVATDVKDGMALPGLPGGYLSGRGTFDTPFYNGGGKDLEPLFPADQQVCIDSQGCGGRSEINYFAQGMWSADSGESLDDALGTTIWWNETQYNLTETEIQGKLYWTRYGYLWYKNWREWGDDWRKHWKPPMPNPNTNNNGATPQ